MPHPPLPQRGGAVAVRPSSAVRPIHKKQTVFSKFLPNEKNVILTLPKSKCISTELYIVKFKIILDLQKSCMFDFLRLDFLLKSKSYYKPRHLRTFTTCLSNVPSTLVMSVKPGYCLTPRERAAENLDLLERAYMR